MNKVEIAVAQAQAQRDEAKRLLGQFIIDQAAADRVVDCIIGAAMLEITAAMCTGMDGAA